MKPSKSSSGAFKPFKNLKTLLKSKSVVLQPSLPEERCQPTADQIVHRPDHAVFKEAMADVKRIPQTKYAAKIPPTPGSQRTPTNPDSETLSQLRKLVEDGTGFVVSLTPEYAEGIARGVNPEIARRLHRGDFSIQDHIDLHGLRVHEARETVDAFLKKCVATGTRAVLIIHGRGLSSRAEPVLKSKIYQWLTSSPWHKWVIAFTSARLCDGGAGATYVLLRRKPMTKRFRKR
jgi:DNA-nicking Smr family endonuclease